MPRTKRLIYDGVVLHVIDRGHNKQKLFKHKDDYYKFLNIVKSYMNRYDFHIFHYCLMGNHFHFLMRIMKEKEPSLIMQGILQSYGGHYKRTYHTSGYLYQGRYKSFLIEKDEYLLGCARYIERNPIRAGIVTDLNNYPWSSYKYYANGKSDDIVTPDPTYETFGRTRQERMRNYVKYVNEPHPYEVLLEKAIEKLM